MASACTATAVGDDATGDQVVPVASSWNMPEPSVEANSFGTTPGRQTSRRAPAETGVPVAV